MKKMLAVLISLTLAATTLFSACSAKESAATPDAPAKPKTEEAVPEAKEAPAYKETIVVGRTSEGVAFDPFVSIDTSTLEVCVQIYDTLVTMNDNMEIVPMLAESWSFVDDLTLEMKLRTDVKFHNGASMTAEDVKFSIERMMQSSASGYIFKFLDSVEAKDPQTVVFKTQEPFAPILAHLSHPAASVFCKAYVEEKGESYGQNPVGTGPYKFVEWKQGDNVKLEAFADYFLGASPTKNLVFRSIPEASQRTIGLETGELDIAYEIMPTDIARMEADPNLTVEIKPGLSYNYLGLNTTKEPFNNVNVRKAVAYAVDKKALAEVVFEGAASAATSPCPPLSFGASADVEPYAYSIEKSKELLAEAGFPDGFSTTLWCRDDQVNTEVAQIIQGNLALVGIDVSLEVMEWGAYLDKTAKGEQEMYILGWSNVTGDANYILYGLYATEQFGVAGNRAFYSNPKVDQLLTDAVSTTDQTKRLAYYAEMQKIVVDESPLVSLYYKNIITGYNKKVEAFVPASTSYHKIYGVKVSK